MSDTSTSTTSTPAAAIAAHPSSSEPVQLILHAVAVSASAGGGAAAALLILGAQRRCMARMWRWLPPPQPSAFPAAYTLLQAGLGMAQSLGLHGRPLAIVTPLEVVATQLAGQSQCRAPHLVPLWAGVCSELKQHFAGSTATYSREAPGLGCCARLVDYAAAARSHGSETLTPPRELTELPALLAEGGSCGSGSTASSSAKRPAVVDDRGTPRSTSTSFLPETKRSPAAASVDHSSARHMSTAAAAGQSTDVSTPSSTVDAAYLKTLHRLYFDGGARGNGPKNSGSGAGCVLLDSNGQPVARAWVYLPHNTNNEAEYEGLLLGLQLVERLGLQNVQVLGDSQLVLYQVFGRYKCKAVNLQGRFVQAKSLLQKLGITQWEWVERSANAQADELSNLAMDTRQSGEWIKEGLGQAAKP